MPAQADIRPVSGAEDRETPFWQMSVEETASRLESDSARGLTETQARDRLARHGPNQLPAKPGASALQLFLQQFRSYIVWILIVAAVVSAFLGEAVDTVAILAIVLLNALLGFFQEHRAEKSLAALRRLSSPSSKVVRDRVSHVVPSASLVPGDIVELEAGDHVPADGRVVFATANFAVQEASLTGESATVLKDVAPIPGPKVPLAERANMVFLGTAVVTGRARALVAGTGRATELGRIAGMLQEIAPESTPLQRKLDEFGRLIIKVCLVLVSLVFLLQWYRGGDPREVFLTAVSLAVAAIPEGLPAVVTIALALGVHRMVRRNALIRKLPSVETLGCATVICSDKTGTLTRNEMTVQAAYAGGLLYEVTGVGYAPTGEFRLDGRAVPAREPEDLRQTLVCGALCNGAQLVEERGAYRIVGDPTEGALLTCAAKAGLDRTALEAQFPYVEELPFESERKMMCVLRRGGPGTWVAFVKGAPDALLAVSDSWQENGRIRPLDATARERILQVNAALADRAMRVLGVACREFQNLPARIAPDTVERNLTFVGLLAMQDPPREEARRAVALCDTAGIRTVMITGDHRNTAVAVARDLGMAEPGAPALAGNDLDALSDAEFEDQAQKVRIYARVSPEHKLRIVRALRGRGHVVAMTGDGVNDAPAVKEADIGIAMGITGTDVTKEVSDMVITDDNFASIVAAVEEGRGIYDNILKFAHYLLSCNTGEILLMFLASLFGLPPPLLPVQLLWINLVTDGFPALALGMDPVAPDTMKRPPRHLTERVITRPRGIAILWQGFVMALCSLAAFLFVYHAHGRDLESARTAAFFVITCCQLVHAFNCRSSTESLFRIGVLSNRRLVYAVALSLALQILVIAVPFLNPVFKTRMPSGDVVCAAAALSLVPLAAVELVKCAQRRLRRPRHGAA